MRQKVSTVLDEMLYRRVRLHAARQGTQISVVLTHAIEEYLDHAGAPRGAGGEVDASWAAIELGPQDVRAVLEEDGLFDA